MLRHKRDRYSILRRLEPKSMSLHHVQGSKHSRYTLSNIYQAVQIRQRHSSVRAYLYMSWVPTRLPIYSLRPFYHLRRYHLDPKLKCEVEALQAKELLSVVLMSLVFH